jgi:hypothetical protein
MYSGPVKIYSIEDTPRIRYIAGIIMGDILGLNWEIVTDRRKIGKNPVINYSKQSIAGSYKITPDPLLFEKQISQKQINISLWNGLPVFFQSNASDIPFDIFAASFYLVTRYEEYLDFSPDKYGRFPSSQSLAVKNGFLDKPVVDLWAKEFSKSLLRKFPNLVFRKNTYNSLLTIDTDQPFAYRGKNILRSIGGIFYDKTSDPVNLSDRYRIMSKTEKDPFDVFDYVLENIEKNDVDAKFFFPVGDRSKYDKNPSWKNAEYRDLIQKIGSKYKIGLHPSFVAGGDGSLIAKEARRLRAIVNQEVNICRFHFIRLSMPRSYKNSMNAGFLEDYSMGYPDEPGFRAGIARPYNFYNIKEENATDLRIVPFQVMDGTLYDYKKLGPDGSREVITKLINETRRAGGLFVSIWHNTSLLDNKERKGWREVFEDMLKSQKP